MRKSVFVLVLLLAAGMVFAATSASGDLNAESLPSASVKITLPLASSDDYESVEVGFSSTAVTVTGTGVAGAIQASDLENVNPTPVTDAEYKLVDENDDGIATLASSKNLYAYWVVKTKQNVSVNLYLDKALTGTRSSGTTINWAVKAGEKTAGNTAGGDVYGSEKSVKIHDVSVSPDTMKYDVGSTSLTIETENFTSKKIDDYAANIVLAVSIES